MYILEYNMQGQRTTILQAKNRGMHATRVLSKKKLNPDLYLKE